MRNKSSLLTLMLAAALLVSCGETGTSPETTASDGTSSEVTTETPINNLPDIKLDGYEFRVLAKEYDASALTAPMVAVDEENGDVINDIVYRRNQKLTEQYDFKISMNIQDDPLSILQNSILAGEDLCDLAIFHLQSGARLVKDNYFVDLNDMKYMDLTRDYYDQSMIRDLSIGNKYYFVSGDLLFFDDDALTITMYNRAMGDNYGIENLYDVAYAGKWTIDVMLENMKKVIQDVDGDGSFHENDIVGLIYASDSKIMPYLAAGGARLVEKDKNDYPKLVDNTEKVQAIYDTMQSILTTPGQAIDWTRDTANTIPTLVTMINDGHTLFQNMILSQVRRFYRDIEMDFGLLPMPKFDENQETYSTYYNAATIQVGYVPISLTDTDNAGFVIEALSSNSKELTSGYYKICLEAKYTRDKESYDMIGLAKENIIIDMAYLYGFGGLSNALNTGIRDGVGFQSTFASLKDKAESEIASYFE